jgi:hypothetical protein
LHNSRICYIRYNSSQRKELSQSTTHWSIPPLSNWGIWLLTQTCQCVFTRLCQCHLALEGDKRLSSFYFGHFSSWIFFYHITKDVNVLHLKSGDSHRLSYFLTSTPSRHTSNHHGRPITSHWFLTCKYGRPSTSSWLLTYIDFQSNFEPTWCHVTSFFFLYFTPLYISLIYNVFLNKDLHVLNNSLSFCCCRSSGVSLYVGIWQGSSFYVSYFFVLVHGVLAYPTSSSSFS